MRTSVETTCSDSRIGMSQQAQIIELPVTPFDQRHYRELIRARGETIRRVVERLKRPLALANALDAGCGVGFFAQVLQECGLYVLGFDARAENVTEARTRFRRIPFAVEDIENPAVTRMGKFDLVLCFGLLYHLENPMLAMRNLRALTRRGLLVESMCAPGKDTTMTMREEPSQEDQSLALVAFCASESCLVKMLYRAGFAAVHRVTALPEHEDFRETLGHARRRTVLFAACEPVDPGSLEAAGLEAVAEPKVEGDLWARQIRGVEAPGLAWRAKNFLAKPAKGKYVAVARRVRRVFPSMPVPLRLEFGCWWLAEDSALDRELIDGGFERAEMGFVSRLLRPGMTVLDIGAHHGLYTLLAAKRVGARGRVIAFEPSPREKKRLQRHVRLNRATNVSIQGVALGDEAGEADLFLVEGKQDWCNSLQPPATEERTCRVRVEVRRLDDVLDESGIARVDFIKLDVEGAELSFLHGATKLLAGERRPVILAEVQDIRTRPWGYPAREIIRFLVRARYRWFALSGDGKLLPISAEMPAYDANLVALPEERVEEFLGVLGGVSGPKFADDPVGSDDNSF